MLARLFEEQVRKDPNHLAVKSKQGELTYKELNNAANQLAVSILERCMQHGKKGVMVALIFEHGFQMIVGTIGALKAGQTYVPLDPGYPEERLAYIIVNAEVGLIVTNNSNAALAEKLRHTLPYSVEIINIDQISPKTAKENLNLVFSPGRLMYLLYTSGSTGQPKGIIQTEANLYYFIKCYSQNLKITTADKMTLFSAFSHDAALMDIYGGLLNGATLYPLSIKEIDFTTLASWLRTEKISIYHSVPTVFRYFLQELTCDQNFPDLRYIVLGGESLLTYDITMFKQYFGTHTVLMNLYGQSESSYNSAQYFTPETFLTKITLGVPNEGTNFCVITDEGEEVAELEVGEIIVFNDHVALGYWKDAIKTDTAFGTDAEFGRFYRTGDLGRMLLNGEIEFVGRKDFQVKIRGYRVELGEIESQLLNHSAVKEAVVIAKEDQNGKFLRAFITLTEDVTQKALREFLQAYLPDYMIPAQFIILEKIPTTPNGKTDRKTLSELEVTIETREYAAPSNPTEKKLLKILTETLDLDQIGVNENFFELGLHSLKVIALMGRIYQEFQVEVSLSEIFAAPTVCELALRVNESEKVGHVIVPCAKKPYYEVSYAQKRLWYISQFSPDSVAYNILGRLSLHEQVEERHIREALSMLIKRHESLRTHFAILEAGLVQIITDEINCPLEVTDLTHLTEEAQKIAAKRVFTETSRPFSLETKELFRVRLIKLEEARYELVFAMHHIISDGSSLEVLKREFACCYVACKAGKSCELEPLAVQYKDFAAWQNRLLADTEKVALVKKFWTDLFSGNLPVINLPVDYSRISLESQASSGYRFVIQDELYRKLKWVAKEYQASLFMVLLAGFTVLLTRLTGDTDLLLGFPSTGRDLQEISNVIGFFVNNGILRSKIDLNESFARHLVKVQEIVLKVLNYQRFPMEMILEELGLKYPHLSVFFNMLNMGETAHEELSDLSSFHIPEVKDAKFELVVYLTEYANCVDVNCHYLCGLFKPTTIEYFMSEYLKIVQKIANEPTIELKNCFMSEKKRKIQFAEV